jgi:hypothetical protein
MEIARSIADLHSSYGQDALRAVPAAVARIMLGWKAEPLLSAWASTAQRLGAIVGSVALGIMAGEISRNFQSTAQWVPIIVIAVAFNAQHVAAKLISISNPLLNLAERQARKRLKKRIEQHENDE